MKIKWIVGGLLWASSYLQAAAQEYKLWYDEPAQVWTEALPLGNGRLGAMVFGNPRCGAYPVERRNYLGRTSQ